MRPIALALLFPAILAAQSVVALDCFHNHESRMPDHYTWEGTRQGGYSELGKVIQALGGRLQSVSEPFTEKALSGVRLLIMVDADTPKETDDPKYISPSEAAALERWVSQGGRLLLLGNDKGNAEFEHWNGLAREFGVEFVEGIHRNAAGASKLNLTSGSSVLGEGLTAYFVDVAPLRLTAKESKVLLVDGDTPILAEVRHGKGLVVALGDPWVYNEYIDHRDNRRMVTNLLKTLMAD